jgi:beta-cyclopiazonate dehydrogenase
MDAARICTILVQPNIYAHHINNPMFPKTLVQLVSVALVLGKAAGVSNDIDESEFKSEDVIERDLCVLGGGASGVYGAIRAKDSGHSVVVVEKNDYLGGHTETLYLDDGSPIDYGVNGVFNDVLSRDFFERLDVEYENLSPDFKTDYVDFATGEKADAPAGVLETVTGALLYRAAIEKYSTLHDGFYKLPDPVPEELLEPFGKFVEKHGLQGALQTVFMFAHQTGNVLDVPLLYVIQAFGVAPADALVKGGYIAPKTGMGKLYESASKVLGDDVILQSTAIKVSRTDSNATLVVKNSNDGSKKLIKAKRLLITFPPLLRNLDGFDLNEEEKSLFGKWQWNSYYVAVLNNTGLPDIDNIANVDTRNTPGNLPTMPFQWQLRAAGAPGYWTTKLVAEANFTQKDSNDHITKDIRRMGTAGTYHADWSPNIVLSGSHNPAALSVSTNDIRDGFYADLYGLQGKRSTYFTGVSFCSDFSSVVWKYTKGVIDDMFSEKT